MLGENTLEKPCPALQNLIISFNIFLFFFVAINNCALGIRWRTGGGSEWHICFQDWTSSQARCCFSEETQNFSKKQIIWIFGKQLFEMDWFAKSNYYNLVPICLVNEDMGLCIRVPSTPSLIIQCSKFNSNTFIHYCSTLIMFAPSNMFASWIYLQIGENEVFKIILKITKNIFPPDAIISQPKKVLPPSVHQPPVSRKSWVRADPEKSSKSRTLVWARLALDSR